VDATSNENNPFFMTRLLLFFQFSIPDCIQLGKAQPSRSRL
jgi:hypothetical protein